MNFLLYLLMIMLNPPFENTFGMFFFPALLFVGIFATSFATNLVFDLFTPRIQKQIMFAAEIFVAISAVGAALIVYLEIENVFWLLSYLVASQFFAIPFVPIYGIYLFCIHNEVDFYTPEPEPVSSATTTTVTAVTSSIDDEFYSPKQEPASFYTMYSPLTTTTATSSIENDNETGSIDNEIGLTADDQITPGSTIDHKTGQLIDRTFTSTEDEIDLPMDNEIGLTADDQITPGSTIDHKTGQLIDRTFTSTEDEIDLSVDKDHDLCELSASVIWV